MNGQVLTKRNVIIAGGLLIGLLALGLVACGGEADEPQEPTATSRPAAQTYQTTLGSVTANGTLRPAQQVALSFGVAGQVSSVEVQVGEVVQPGQALAELDDTDLRRAVAEADLALQSAETRLAQLEGNPLPEELEAATTAVASAQAALNQAYAQAGNRENQTTVDGYNLDQAERALADAQSAYQDVLNDPRTRDWAPSSDAGRALEEAQAYYDVVLAQYEMNANSHAYALAIAQAEAQLAHANLALYRVESPGTPEQVALAQIDVERAQLALDAAQENLARATLAAPFEGVIAELTVDVGERVMASSPAVELLDVSSWQVATQNVGESQIARVRVGQEVNVTVNAFPGETLTGQVAAISPVAVVQQGDTTYTLTIDLEPTDLNLRPGMTARVQIMTEAE